MTNFFPETFTTVNPDGTRPFCDNCDFLQWGAWGARFGFGTDSTSYYADNVHLGWWVAGDVITAAQLDACDRPLHRAAPTTFVATQSATSPTISATRGWTTYVATGD